MLDALLFSKTPALLTAVYSECLWKMETKEKILYLSFDDGPIAEVTPFVLNELKKYDAKATFFCIGKNVHANPEIFQRIIDEGHTIGNHSYDHTNGWNCYNDDYFSNVIKCEVELAKNQGYRSKNLYRAPYGKLKPAQYQYLKERYKIVMWDVLSFDYDRSIPKEKVLDNVVKNAGEGSIIVFHDSLKAKPNMEYALPKVLAHFRAKGFKFEKL